MGSAQIKKMDDGRLSILGELSMKTVPALLAQKDLRGFFNDSRNDSRDDIVIDLQDVERADSAGVALLIEWRRMAQQQQQTIRFQNIPSQMLAIARLSGVDELLALT